MGLIGTFQIFTQAYIMTQGGPVNSTLFYAYQLFNTVPLPPDGLCRRDGLGAVPLGLRIDHRPTQLQDRWVYYEEG